MLITRYCSHFIGRRVMRSRKHGPMVVSSWLISSNCCPWVLCFRLSDSNLASWLFRSYCCLSSLHLHSSHTTIPDNTGCANKKNPLGKINYLSYCNRFCHQIYSFYSGGFRPRRQQTRSLRSLRSYILKFIVWRYLTLVWTGSFCVK